ncbi:MAG: discoidin domain-containing protein, partial [Sedimentisphaerales bacterium]|nr:discoidin domain-containing protein [Sedimentisphaerales bacterium]
MKPKKLGLLAVISLAFCLSAYGNPLGLLPIYYDNFDGTAGQDLDGTKPDVTQEGVVWQAGSAVKADGTLGPLFTAALPFTPELGKVYELIATFDNQGDWAAIGFLSTISNINTRILDNAPILWCLTRQTGATNFDQAFLGPGTGNALGDFITSSAEELRIRLETNSDTEWMVTFFFDGQQAFQRTINPASYTINYVAFGANGMFLPMSGRIKSFLLAQVGLPPEFASNPYPKDGATDVPKYTILSWSAGIYPGTHDVYMGTEFEDVNTATRNDPKAALVAKGLTTTSYDPQGALHYGRTYYWRVDEVNANDGHIYKGAVWTFTVEPYSYPVQPIDATASSSWKTSTGPKTTIGGVGLTNDGHSTTTTDMWISQSVPAWIQYEFDKVYKLDQVWVWNHNQQIEPAVNWGAKDVEILYSEDGQTWNSLGMFEFAQAPGEEGYVSDIHIGLGGVLAKYVKLDIKATQGGTKASISEVRFYAVPLAAFNPEPSDGATDIAVDAVLNWRPGRQADEHKVYIDIDKASVEAATITAKTVKDHRLSLLDVGAQYDRTYYWRVDEVNNAAVPPEVTGNIWSFSTTQYKVVDDFEGYDDRCNRIFYSWSDR